MSRPPEVNYRSIAREAGLDEQQIRTIEQLFNVPQSVDIFVAKLGVYGVCQRIRDGLVGVDAVQRLLDRRMHLEREIFSAFAGVTRDGGTSWSEGWAIDCNGSDEECRAARESDRDQSWEQLVDVPNWNHDVGPWSFLDAIGFRYYLAPTMIRAAREGGIAAFAYALDHPVYGDELRTLLTPAQHAAIHHFLQYLLDVSATFQWPDNDSPTLQQLAEKWNVRGI